MISPVVDGVLNSFLFGRLWIQFVSHHEIAIFYVQGYEFILECGNKVDYQKAWLRSQKFWWFLMYLVLSASGASRAEREAALRPHAWEADDGWLLLAVRDTVVPSAQDKIIHASQIWGPHMESLLTFLPSHPIDPSNMPLSSDVPSPGLSHSILLLWSSWSPRAPSTAQPEQPSAMASEHANFLVPRTQLRLCGRGWEALSASPLYHCVPAGCHCQAFFVLLSLWDPLPTSPSACPLGSKGGIFSKDWFHTSSFFSPWFKIVMKQQLTDQQCTFCAIPAFPSRGQNMVHTAEHCLLAMDLALESHQLEPSGSDSLRAITTSLAEALRILTKGVM